MSRRSRTARRIKTTTISSTPFSFDSESSTVSSPNTQSSTSFKRTGALREEADNARTKRLRGLAAQTSGVRAAASALVTASGAQPDDGVPAYVHSPYEYEDDLGWEEVQEPPEITNAGGVVGDMLRVAYQIVTPGHKYKKLRPKFQERRARLEASTRSWDRQMDGLVEQYLRWKSEVAGDDHEMEVEQHHFEVTAISTFSRVRAFRVLQKPGEEANVALIRAGMIGCSSDDPAVAISLDTLELYHRLRRRNGQLSVQAMARTLCDLHNHTYLTHYRDQFSIAFDVYLGILRHVKLQTDAALGRDTPHWRALNACPPCNYELEGETRLVPRAFHVCDGNYSYKRAANAGLVDQRVFPSDYVIPRDQVNKFQYEVKSRAREAQDELGSDDEEIVGDSPWVGLDAPGDSAGQEVETPCAKNWRAAQEKLTALAIYDINGGLPVACRHGLIEGFCEIVRSGELAKYPLAATNFILEVYGHDQALGFDIACSFDSTVKNSTMLGGEAKTKRLQVIVNAFHGWAHNRLCQLKYHPLYRTGMGLEDLETLERFFSSSNTIARTNRHATVFHWHQATDLHFRQWDEQKYQELSNFMLSNYQQAIKIIKDYTPEVRAFKERLNIDDQVLDGWLEDEKRFLEDLKEEPDERVLACAYVEALQTRHKADNNWQTISDEILNPPTALVQDYAGSVRWTSRIEASRRSAQEQLTVAIRAVADLETRLLLRHPWTEDTPEYKDTAAYIHQRQYHRALNKLEQLVVQRLFELSKANVVGMGYKLRESIWRALKTRGKAIRTALDKYNKIAPKMVPPAPLLEWKQLMDYSFISEFDILKHTHSHRDITTEPWTAPLNREMATKHHKLKRAYEEIDRIHHEGPRLRTSIYDEHSLYIHHINRLQELNPPLASELERLWAQRRRVNATHIERLNILEAIAGYAGRRGRGVRKGKSCVGSGEEVSHGSADGSGVPADKSNEDDIWRQGREDSGGRNSVQDDAPDDEVSEGILDLTEQFSADLRLVNGVPETMLFQFVS